MFRPFWGDAHFGLPPFAQWGPCIKKCPDLWLEMPGTEGHLAPLFLSMDLYQPRNNPPNEKLAH